ncbi:MAG: YidC/Oxa1 family membrane protein insertase [Oscillospiraceae bacterium]|jgi:YidC/Oxa1 family membrane protein insertase|nr:YidC/Oxa1 family membrane protein insertase [Oscillospiraceae bacterium]
MSFYNAIYDVLGVVFGPILRVIYEVVHNYGVAIILFTVFCRLLMLPGSISQQKKQAQSQRMQFKIRKLQEKYKDDKQKLQQETQAVYQREGYNPMSAGCSGGMMIQFPIIFGLIAAIYRPLKYTLQISAEAIQTMTDKASELLGEAILGKAGTNTTTIQLTLVEQIEKFKSLIGTGGLTQAVYDRILAFKDDFSLFGLNLGLKPSDVIHPAEGVAPVEVPHVWLYWAIPILAALASMATSLYSYFKQRKLNPEQSKNPMMGCMTFGMPIFSGFISVSFPVGIGMYWIASSLIAFIQTVILNYTHSPQKMTAKLLIDETIERRSREDSRKRTYERLNAE